MYINSYYNAKMFKVQFSLLHGIFFPLQNGAIFVQKKCITFFYYPEDCSELQGSVQPGE